MRSINNLDELREEVLKQKEFKFKSKWVYPYCPFLIGSLVAGIALSIFLPPLAIIAFIVFIGLFLYLFKMKQEMLIINPKEIRFEKGFKPRVISYDDIDSIEYYSETTNGWSTDYYAKFILKNGKPIKKSLYYWKVPYKFDSYIYLKTIIETYYLLNKRKIKHNQHQSKSTDAWKYCVQCGAKNKGSNKFCSECGKKLT